MKSQNRKKRNGSLVLGSLILVLIVAGFVSKALAARGQRTRVYPSTPGGRTYIDPGQVRVPGDAGARTPSVP